MHVYLCITWSIIFSSKIFRFFRKSYVKSTVKNTVNRIWLFWTVLYLAILLVNMYSYWILISSRREIFVTPCRFWLGFRGCTNFWLGFRGLHQILTRVLTDKTPRAPEHARAAPYSILEPYLKVFMYFQTLLGFSMHRNAISNISVAYNFARKAIF